VFEIVEGTTLRYGAPRMTHVGRDYLIFDWSFQPMWGTLSCRFAQGSRRTLHGTTVSGSQNKGPVIGLNAGVVNSHSAL